MNPDIFDNYDVRILKNWDNKTTRAYNIHASIRGSSDICETRFNVKYTKLGKTIEKMCNNLSNRMG